MSRLIEQLESEGIKTIPSIQSGGRLNGMSYEFNGVRINGSTMGRAYTARGLQRELGVNYDPKRDDQRLYAGFVKPNEVKHDLAIFRMHQVHSAKIEGAGGTVQRVVLDFELKKAVYSKLAKANGIPALEYARKKEQIAAENGLKTVEGRVILPDLRIEYETADGELAKVDLEVTSEDYKRSQMQQKARAGFTVYALGLKASSRCSAIQDGPEAVAGLLSF